MYTLSPSVAPPLLLQKQGITNTLALSIDNVLYYRVHTLNTGKISSNLNSLNTSTKETGSFNVKLPKVGSNAMVPAPHRDRAQQIWDLICDPKWFYKITIVV